MRQPANATLRIYRTYLRFCSEPNRTSHSAMPSMSLVSTQFPRMPYFKMCAQWWWWLPWPVYGLYRACYVLWTYQTTVVALSLRPHRHMYQCAVRHTSYHLFNYPDRPSIQRCAQHIEPFSMWSLQCCVGLHTFGVWHSTKQPTDCQGNHWNTLEP